jgi:site-specific DNA-cytosine methylase
MQDLIQAEELLQEDFPAKTSALLAKGLALLGKEAGYSGRLQDLWKKRKANTSSSKTSLVCYPVTKEKILESSSGLWPTSGILSAGVCLMLNTSEYPSEGAEYSLLESVVKTQPNQQKYYLTAKAAEGVLRRSPSLPEKLRQAFENVVAHKTQEEDVSDSTLLFEATRVSDTRFYDKYSPTVATYWGTGGARVPYVVNKQEPIRRLTPVECERLQGFPDNWTEQSSDSTRYRQVGNAIAVPVVEWIVEGIRAAD